jgi:hypothetical protein
MFIKSGTRDKLNVCFECGLAFAEKGRGAIEQRTNGDHRCRRGLRQNICERHKRSEPLRWRSDTDRRSSEGTTAEGPENVKGYSDEEQTDAIDGCAEESRDGAEGEIGQNKGRKEECLMAATLLTMSAERTQAPQSRGDTRPRQSA